MSIFNYRQLIPEDESQLWNEINTFLQWGKFEKHITSSKEKRPTDSRSSPLFGGLYWSGFMCLNKPLLASSSPSTFN